MLTRAKKNSYQAVKPPNPYISDISDNSDDETEAVNCRPFLNDDHGKFKDWLIGKTDEDEEEGHVEQPARKKKLLYRKKNKKLHRAWTSDDLNPPEFEKKKKYKYRKLI